jgi:hypothetical protein
MQYSRGSEIQAEINQEINNLFSVASTTQCSYFNLYAVRKTYIQCRSIFLAFVLEVFQKAADIQICTL